MAMIRVTSRYSRYITQIIALFNNRALYPSLSAYAYNTRRGNSDDEILNFSSKCTPNMDRKMEIIAHNHVALSLSKQLILPCPSQYYYLDFSPLSIYMALSMLTTGFTIKYRKNLLIFLCTPSSHHLNSFASNIVFKIFFDSSPANGPRLSSVNGLWLNKSYFVNPSFKKLMETAYKATILNDFRNKVRFLIFTKLHSRFLCQL
ncbi:hypothetical protein CDL15_Pgr014956 [Punica granatum]|uniref:Serpin domain-containing protein n=1 Tax=Punica granatum TaxID=22663 RepID=A0A218WZD9_PUNGR|nr:hypothetical protein CDL15_Pgr014956 [Punica granatum]PKI45569.1 hypothetical protein CRG98_034087 [Punica granatum]